MNEIEIIGMWELGPRIVRIPPAWVDRDDLDFNLDQRWAVVAIRDGMIVGYWTFGDPRIIDGRVRVRSEYTYVVRSMRKTDLASKMWLYGCHALQIGNVDVCIISDGGFNLMRRIVPLVWQSTGTAVEVDGGGEYCTATLYRESLQRALPRGKRSQVPPTRMLHAPRRKPRLLGASAA